MIIKKHDPSPSNACHFTLFQTKRANPHNSHLFPSVIFVSFVTPTPPGPDDGIQLPGHDTRVCGAVYGDSGAEHLHGAHGVEVCWRATHDDDAPEVGRDWVVVFFSWGCLKMHKVRVEKDDGPN